MLARVIAWLAGVTGSAFVGSVSTPNPVIDAANQFFNRLLQITLMPPDILAYLRSRDIITEEQYLDMMKDWGYNEAFAKAMYEALRNRPTVSELIRGIFYRYAKPDNIEDVWASIKEYLRD